MQNAVIRGPVTASCIQNAVGRPSIEMGGGDCKTAATEQPGGGEGVTVDRDRGCPCRVVGGESEGANRCGRAVAANQLAADDAADVVVVQGQVDPGGLPGIDVGVADLTTPCGQWGEHDGPQAGLRVALGWRHTVIRAANDPPAAGQCDGEQDRGCGHPAPPRAPG